MKFATILQLFITYLYRVNSQLNCPPFQVVFNGITNIINSPIWWKVGGRWPVGSHKVAGKGYVNTENSQRVSIGDIFTSTYHTKQLNPWPKSLASRVVNYSQLPACQGEMELFEDHPSTRGCLTSLRNKPTAKAAWATFSTNPG